MRKVLVFSTKSNTTTPVETSATNWGELSTYLTQKGLYNASGMKAIVKETKTTLELKEANLPEGNFVLYLIPVKNESGAEVVEADDLMEYISSVFAEVEKKIEDYIQDNVFEADDSNSENKEEAAAIRAELGLRC